MVSLAAFLKYKGDKPFGGVIGLSGMQGLQFKPEDISIYDMAIKKQIPLFLYHGVADTVLPVKNVHLTY